MNGAYGTQQISSTTCMGDSDSTDIVSIRFPVDNAGTKRTEYAFQTNQTSGSCVVEVFFANIGSFGARRNIEFTVIED